MNWYILLAHPNPGSFNHAVCHAFVEGLDQAGASYEVNDLYATGFNPLMAGDDFNQFEDGRTLPADVLDEQSKVQQADYPDEIKEKRYHWAGTDLNERALHS